MRALVVTLVTLLALVYPLIIYVGVHHLSPAVLALGLLALTVARLLLARAQFDGRQIALLVIMLLYSALSAVADSEWLLRLYPVIISLCLAMIFLLTLSDDQSLIEKLARVAGKVITPNAKRYTRGLTAVWACALVFNAGVAFYLALYASLRAWAFYCGVLSYLLFGCLFLIEFLYRHYYIRKYGA